MTTTVDWMLVADRSQAKIYQGPPGPNNHFAMHVAFEHPEGRLRRQDMESDEPGRITLAGGSRTATEEHEGPEHREARKFATKLCSYLDGACKKHDFDRLVVIAPPFFLGVLRDHFTGPVKSRILCEIDLDLAPLTDPQIHPRLAAILETCSGKQKRP